MYLCIDATTLKAIALRRAKASVGAMTVVVVVVAEHSAQTPDTSVYAQPGHVGRTALKQPVADRE